MRNLAKTPVGILCAAGVFVFSTATGAAGEPPASFPSTMPAPASQRVLRFADGVTIDWTTRALRVDGSIVLREGPLEFLACFAGKEHESIVRLHASGTSIFMALGLLGLAPGHPPRWSDDERSFAPPDGELIDIAFEWDAGRSRANAFSWLREVEYGREPLPRPWVFAGSKRSEDATLLCDRSGVGVALVDFSDSLICLTRSHVSRDEELWADAHTAAIPPLKTPVTMVIRAARPLKHEVTVDFRGVAFVDGRFASTADLIDVIQLQRKLDPQRVQTVTFEGTLRSDRAALLGTLSAAGLKVETREQGNKETRRQ
ncbi:hypothetical protein RAS1_18510 [Phycisphaerae bacterium RAS1]|nr:hypothetical protein RAS1_18510 [Phycisphaerae bacterium RAS1]